MHEGWLERGALARASDHREAAVDTQYLTRDPVRIVAREEHHGTADVARLTQPAGRVHLEHALRSALVLLGSHLLQQRGLARGAHFSLSRTGRDDIERDAGTSHFL